MSTKFFLDNAKRELEDFKTFPSAFQKLCELAETEEKGIVQQWKYPDLFKWLNHSTFSSAGKNSKLVVPVEFDDDYTHHYYISAGGKNYSISVITGCGTEMWFMKLTEKEFDEIFPSVEFASIALYNEIYKLRLPELEENVDKLQKQYDKEQSAIKEVETKLKSVECANALMAVFGLKLDEESEKKVNQWREDLAELKDPGGFIRKMQEIRYGKNKG